MGYGDTDSEDSPYDALISNLETKYGLPEGSFRALVQTESNFNPQAKSSAGALGLTQLMPGTAKDMGVTDPLDPTQNLAGGAKYFSKQYNDFGHDLPLAYAAYNVGPGAVRQAGGVPNNSETPGYVQKNMSRLMSGMVDSMGAPPQAGSNDGGVSTTPSFTPQGTQTMADIIPSTTGGSDESDASSQTPSKKSWKDKLLPLLFKVGIPTVASTVLGAENPFMGTGAGLLYGLGRGGANYVRDNERMDLANQKIQSKAKDDALEKSKMTLAQRKEVFMEEAARQKALADQAGTEQEKQQALQNYELNKRKVDILEKATDNKIEKQDDKIDPADRTMEYLANQLKNKKLDPENPEDVELFKRNFLSKTKSADWPIYEDQTHWFSPNEPSENLMMMMKNYNDYIDRGNPASSKPTQNYQTKSGLSYTVE